MGQKRRGTVLPQVGKGKAVFVCCSNNAHNICFHLSLKKTVDKLIEDIFLYNMILWGSLLARTHHIQNALLS